MARSRDPEQNATTVARLGRLVSDVPEVLPNVRYRVTNGHQLLKPALQPLTQNRNSPSSSGKLDLELKPVPTRFADERTA
jgi:hypothetical protein